MQAGEGKDRGLKTALCICFLLVFGALILIDRNSPATGYELSIYDSLPVLTWIFLIAAIAGGTGVIVHQAFAGRRSRYWFLGFFALVLSISIILLLSIIRSYYFYGGGDTVAHMAWTEEVISTRHVRVGLMYPITHILTAQLALVCGAPVDMVMKYVPLLFTLLFVLFSYLLASSVMPHKGQALLSAASTALFFGYYHICVYPQGLSVMALPMVFYLYFKSFGASSLPFRAAFVIALLFFPFFHPAPAAVLIACLLAAEAAKVIWRARRGTTPSPVIRALDRINLEPTLISSVAFLTWISSHAIFGTAIRRTLGLLVGELEGMPKLEVVETLIASQTLTTVEQILLGLKMYGDNLIYLSLTAIALLMIGWQFLRRQDDVKNLFTLSMPFVISGPVWILIFAGTMAVTVGRLLGSNVMMWATPVFAALALYEMFRRWRRVGIIAATSVLLCASVVGIFGVYHSPHILQESWQVSRQEIQGSGWFFEHADLQAREGFLNWGVHTGFALGRLYAPEHFGYARAKTLSETLGGGWYVLLTERFRVCSTHPDLTKAKLSRCALHGFNQGDFQRLERDPSVDRLYSNGELDVLMTTVQSERS